MDRQRGRAASPQLERLLLARAPGHVVAHHLDQHEPLVRVFNCATSPSPLISRLTLRSSCSFVRYKQDFWLYETDEHIWDPNGILTWLASELDLAEKSGQRAWISASSCFRYLLTAAPSLARRSWTHVVRQDGHDAGPVELRESDLPPLSQDDRSAVLRTQVRNCCLRCRPHSSLCRHTVTRMSLRYRTLTTRTVAPIPRPASLLSRAR